MPVHFLIQYPITTTIIPPNKKYIINSDDPPIEEKEKFLAIIIPYSTILVISLFEKNRAARILPK